MGEEERVRQSFFFLSMHPKRVVALGKNDWFACYTQNDSRAPARTHAHFGTKGLLDQTKNRGRSQEKNWFGSFFPPSGQQRPLLSGGTGESGLGEGRRTSYPVLVASGPLWSTEAGPCFGWVRAGEAITRSVSLVSLTNIPLSGRSLDPDDESISNPTQFGLSCNSYTLGQADEGGGNNYKVLGGRGGGCRFLDASFLHYSSARLPPSSWQYFGRAPTCASGNRPGQI